MDVTKKIAEYVVNTSLEDFPPEAITAAKAAIIDCLGCALAGSKEPLADVLVNYLNDLGGNPAALPVAEELGASGAVVLKPRPMTVAVGLPPRSFR